MGKERSGWGARKKVSGVGGDSFGISLNAESYTQREVEERRSGRKGPLFTFSLAVVAICLPPSFNNG